MKLGKKLLSVLMTMVLVFAMVVPAMADGTKITITNGANDSGYSAWKVLGAEEIVGTGGSTYKYSVNEKYMDALKAVIPDGNDDTSSKIITYISKLSGTKLQKFADDLYKELKEMDCDAEIDKDSTNKVFTVGQGYYLIAETTKGANPDTVSKVMLDTKGLDDITVATKEGTVELEKKVKEKNDTTGATNLQDGADYDFGDHVPFQLKGTLPANYNEYTTYYYQFVDNLPTGLTFDTNSLKVYVASKNETDINAAGVEEIEGGFAVQTTGTGFTVTFDNLKTIVESLDKDNPVAIFVSYTATLTEGAAIGATGNKNEAHVVFSNDPYSNGKGQTVDDVVIVFTYEFDVNKVDGAGNSLEGAGFTLEKKIDGVWVAVSEEITGENITKFVFKGLDSGEYRLKETKVPDGYNKADDIVFTIEATYDTKEKPLQFEKLTITGITKNAMEDTDGKFETNVENLTGIELPSTGGIGTTIFYAAGGILVVGAAILLIAKKRVENEE